MKKYDLWPKTAFYKGGPLDPPHVITYVVEPMWNRVNDFRKGMVGKAVIRVILDAFQFFHSKHAIL